MFVTKYGMMRMQVFFLPSLTDRWGPLDRIHQYNWLLGSVRARVRSRTSLLSSLRLGQLRNALSLSPKSISITFPSCGADFPSLVKPGPHHGRPRPGRTYHGCCRILLSVLTSRFVNLCRASAPSGLFTVPGTLHLTP